MPGDRADVDPVGLRQLGGVSRLGELGDIGVGEHARPGVTATHHGVELDVHARPAPGVGAQDDVVERRRHRRLVGAPGDLRELRDPLLDRRAVDRTLPRRSAPVVDERVGVAVERDHRHRLR